MENGETRFILKEKKIKTKNKSIAKIKNEIM